MILGPAQSQPPPSRPAASTDAIPVVAEHARQPVAFTALMDRTTSGSRDRGETLAPQADVSADGPRSSSDNALHSFSAASLFETHAIMSQAEGTSALPAQPIIPQHSVGQSLQPAGEITVLSVGNPLIELGSHPMLSAGQSRGPARLAEVAAKTSPIPSASPAYSPRVQTNRGLTEVSPTLPQSKRSATPLPVHSQIHVTVAAGAQGFIVAGRLNGALPDEIEKLAQEAMKIADELGSVVETVTINGRPIRSDPLPKGR